jgi:aminoglycoside phosphotransferase (APT) family kinase protein
MNSHNNPAADIRSGESLDFDALQRHLKSVIPGLSGEAEFSQYPGGNSNLTYRVAFPGNDLVLRRPPFGTKARSAHSMIREYRVVNALRPVFPTVPETMYYSDDESIIGSEFYVMRRVEGNLVRHVIPPEWGFSNDDRRRFCVSFWEKLIELHQVDVVAAGLADFGRPQGYVERQILGWNGRFEKALTPDQDPFVDVRDWLEQGIGTAREDCVAILHGDYRIDNVIWSDTDRFSIRALLDWEISALGHPLMDLGNALAYWVEAGDPGYLQTLKLQPSAEEGMLTRAEILDLYSRKTGFDTTNFTFYYTYGLFRNAVILQQIYFRYFHSQTTDPRFEKFGRIAKHLCEHCRLLIREST